MNPVSFAGEKKKVGLISPKPNAFGAPGATAGWLMMGMIVRVSRFQSLLRLIGITGCTFMMYCVTFAGP